MKISKNNITYSSAQFCGLNPKKIDKVLAPAVKSMKESSIFGQDNCWRLYKPEVFESFIKGDEELSGTLTEVMETARVYGLTLTIDMLRGIRKIKPEVEEFFDKVKSKYEIDLDIPPKVYRFVGKSEVDELMKSGIIRSQRGYWDKIDVTLNPDLNWNDYRITFKPKEKFSVLAKNGKIKENIGTGHDYYYTHEGPYTIDDVEKIEKYRE